MSKRKFYLSLEKLNTMNSAEWIKIKSLLFTHAAIKGFHLTTQRPDFIFRMKNFIRIRILNVISKDYNKII